MRKGDKHSKESRQRMSRAASSRGLTIKQERFVKQYARLANGTKAAKAAGYQGDENTLNVTANRDLLLRNPAVISAVNAELERISRETEISQGRVQRRLHKISYSAEDQGQFAAAVRAEELIGKSVGMFVDKSVNITGTLTEAHLDALIALAKDRAEKPVDLGTRHNAITTNKDNQRLEEIIRHGVRHGDDDKA